MKCQKCGYDETKVTDSRPLEDSIKRRRVCPRCSFRFNTYEKPEKPLLMVRKRDGEFEPFDRNKLVRGVYNAIKKRPVSAEQVERIADHIENHCANKFIEQIDSVTIGDMTLECLRDIDSVAYIRFASVYKDFSDVESFVQAISELNRCRCSDTE